MSTPKRGGKKRRFSGIGILIAVLIFSGAVLLLRFIIAGRHLHTPGSPPAAVTPSAVDKKQGGAVALPDTAHIPDRAEKPVMESRRRAGQKAGTQDSAGRAKAADTARDTVKETASSADKVPDTATRKEEDVLLDSIDSGCDGDTLPPRVYPEPSGGLHHGPISVAFRANRPCSIWWRFEGDTAWHAYAGAGIAIEKSGALDFRAIDTCGRRMEEREEYYEIDRTEAARFCPRDMEPVTIGSMRFCIDRYEWPNRKGALPRSYISLYQAVDSCFSRGKRLCSSEEWSLACSGPYSWKYPYGQNYEPYACRTHDTAARPSGSAPECRAYFGAFDMSGNLLEWTRTQAKENRQYFNVMGGFWESGPRSGCFDIRYSYFPQNRHNPVGFRCCKDAAPSGVPAGK